MKRSAFLLIVLASWTGVAAADQPPPPPSPSTADDEFFEKKVRPLLVERCHKCHSTQAKKRRGGLLLDSRVSILKGGDSGPAVVPADPDKSLLVQAVRYQNEQVQMPPTGKLAEAEVAVLAEWVRRGAPFPGSADTAGKKSGINLAEGRKFWSFQPPRLVTPPAVQMQNWPQRRVDAFLLAEMEKRGLAPSPAADRRTLIRRASFDLIGLPPTPDEVDAFVNDQRPDAYPQLVERLLASPLYGERWGRFWLDLVRYADIREDWSESKAPAYPYRDWVVQAFNDDLPYDQFVQRQLAADLMPESGTRRVAADRAALGFLGLSPTYWKELKLDRDVIKTVVAEEWEERIGAVGGTFLGLTVACARCHDHKFDPISQEDYYALAGVFASVRPADRPMIAEELAARAQQARERVKELQVRLGQLQEMKPMPADAHKQAEELNAEIERLKKTPHYDTPPACALEDASLYVLADGPHRTKLEYKPGVAQDVNVQVRGNPANAGAVVPRRFLAVLSSGEPKPFRQGSGRLELARAIVTEGAPLAARVIVNRVWKHHFGAGLVDTPSDFGAQGARPSHPALLDDLTARFIASGWSLKWLHREIMLSAAYQQASGHEERKRAIDPDNRWLWRMNRRRLEIEAWRDAMLAVSGTLTLERGGPSLDLGDARNRRRTVYGTVKRRELNDMLRLYDFPDPTTHSPGRLPTTTPLQQLFVLNSPFVQQQSAALARRLRAEAPGSTEDRVRRAYLLLYGRAATEGQMRLAVEFLQTDKSAEAAALWQQYAQVLLGSNEFLFVD
jgi:hypothetical protein